MSACQIVEIGAMVSSTGSSFATVVRPTCESEPGKEMAARQGCAHRALDDVVALHDVISCVGEAVSLPMSKLLLPFMCDFDIVASLVDIAASH